MRKVFDIWQEKLATSIRSLITISSENSASLVWGSNKHIETSPAKISEAINMATAGFFQRLTNDPFKLVLVTCGLPTPEDKLFYDEFKIDTVYNLHELYRAIPSNLLTERLKANVSYTYANLLYSDRETISGDVLDLVTWIKGIDCEPLSEEVFRSAMFKINGVSLGVPTNEQITPAELYLGLLISKELDPDAFFEFYTEVDSLRAIP